MVVTDADQQLLFYNSAKISAHQRYLHSIRCQS